jgi:hypothetical protein
MNGTFHRGTGVERGVVRGVVTGEVKRLRLVGLITPDIDMALTGLMFG